MSSRARSSSSTMTTRIRSINPCDRANRGLLQTVLGRCAVTNLRIALPLVAALAWSSVSASVAEEALETSRSLPVYEVAGGVAAAAVTVPASIYLGSWIGTQTNNLVAAALPSLGIAALVPP